MNETDFIKALEKIDVSKEEKIKIIDKCNSEKAIFFKNKIKMRILAVSVALIILSTGTMLAIALNKSPAEPVINNTSGEESSFLNSQITSENQSEEGKGGYGDEEFCIHEKVWYSAYHMIPQPLQELVGTEAFIEWEERASSQNKTAECQYGDLNIYNFIHEFNISKKDFCDAYYIKKSNYFRGDYYMFWFDVDSLYSCSKDQYESIILQNKDSIEKEMQERDVESSFKCAIMVMAGMEEEQKQNCTMYSIPQLIYDNDISRSDLETRLIQLKEAWATKDYEMPDYDFDMIYNKEPSLLDALEKVKREELYPVQVDEIIRK